MVKGLIAIAAGLAVCAGLGTGYYDDLRDCLIRNSCHLWFISFFNLIIRILIIENLTKEE